MPFTRPRRAQEPAAVGNAPQATGTLAAQNGGTPPGAAEAGPTGKPGGTAAAPSQARRLPSLTGLRFPAALLVFIYHQSLALPNIRLLASNSAENDFYKLGAYAGPLGVTFFFMLSGFVLTWSARPSDSARKFWRRRFVKIVPNYIVAWALAMVLIARATVTAPQGILTFFMLQSWVPNPSTNFGVDSPGWSLSVEMFFYLCFPVVYFAIKRIPPRYLKTWIAVVIAGIALTPLIAAAIVPAGHGGAVSDPSVPANHFWFDYIFPPARLLDFALGILVARAVMLGRWRNIGMIWSGLLLIAAYAASFYVPYLYAVRVMCVIPAALLIAAGALADSNGKFTIFRNRAAVWLGEISYAFYLVHYIVIVYCRSLLGQRLFSVPAWAGLLVAEACVATLIAWAMYTLVEKPAMRRWARSR